MNIRNTRDIRNHRYSIALLGIVLLLLLSIAPHVHAAGGSAPTPDTSAATAMIKQATESLQGVEALNSAVSSGVNYADYGKRRADARIAVDKFTNAYGTANQFAQYLMDALNYHDAASMLWDAYFEDKEASHHFIPASNSTVVILFKYLPELKKQTRVVADVECLYLDTGLSYLWNLASESTVSARRVLESIGKAKS